MALEQNPIALGAGSFMGFGLRQSIPIIDVVLNPVEKGQFAVVTLETIGGERVATLFAGVGLGSVTSIG